MEETYFMFVCLFNISTLMKSKQARPQLIFRLLL